MYYNSLTCEIMSYICTVRYFMYMEQVAQLILDYLYTSDWMRRATARL